MTKIRVASVAHSWPGIFSHVCDVKGHKLAVVPLSICSFNTILTATLWSPLTLYRVTAYLNSRIRPRHKFSKKYNCAFKRELIHPLSKTTFFVSQDNDMNMCWSWVLGGTIDQVLRMSLSAYNGSETAQSNLHLKNDCPMEQWKVTSSLLAEKPTRTDPFRMVCSTIVAWSGPEMRGTSKLNSLVATISLYLPKMSNLYLPVARFLRA